jgi:hypothetical protein
MDDLKQNPVGRRERISRVLETNSHLASRVCYTFSIGGVPAYIVVPTGWQLRLDLLRAIASSGCQEHWSVLIGRRGPLSTPTTCGGILAPIVACDQVYSFTLDEWRVSLESNLGPALKAKKIDSKMFIQTTRELFEHIVGSTENLGVTNAHRALNYLVMQHAGLFLAAAERSGKQLLDRIETREIQGIGTRQVIAVIMTFLDLTTGVPERLFCRVDVTEEWPFVADSADGSRSPFGLLPFVDNGIWGMPF